MATVKHTAPGGFVVIDDSGNVFGNVFKTEAEAQAARLEECKSQEFMLDFVHVAALTMLFENTYSCGFANCPATTEAEERQHERYGCPAEKD